VKPAWFGIFLFKFFKEIIIIYFLRHIEYQEISWEGWHIEYQEIPWEGWHIEYQEIPWEEWPGMLSIPGNTMGGMAC
jgi:hypothetical protein